MKNFQEFEVKELQDVMGGMRIRIILSAMLAANTGIEDVVIERDVALS